MAVNPIPGTDTSSYTTSGGSLQETSIVEGAGGGSGGQVEVTNWPATQEVSVSGSVEVNGPLTDAEFTAVSGLLSSQPYSDDTGATDGSVIGLLKGIYVQNVQIIGLLTQIEENTSA